MTMSEPSEFAKKFMTADELKAHATLSHKAVNKGGRFQKDTAPSDEQLFDALATALDRQRGKRWPGDVSGAFVDLCRDHDDLVVRALRIAAKTTITADSPTQDPSHEAG
jgi:hypothetical protein